MKFSTLAVASALFVSSAAAFSVQPSTAMPKTALYASSNDDSGVLERRQVLSTIAATAVASLGASSAFAATNAADQIKDNAKGLERGLDGRGITDPGTSSKMGENLGRNMGDRIGAGNALENVKNDAKTVASNLNPMSGNNPMSNMGNNMNNMGKNMGNNMNMGNPMNNMGMGGMGNPAQAIKDNAKGIERNTGAANKLTSKVSSDVNTVKGQGGMNNMNPFSGNNNPMNNMGNNMGMGGMGNPADKIKDNAKGIERNTGASNRLTSKVSSDVNTVKGQGGGFFRNPFAGNNPTNDLPNPRQAANKVKNDVKSVADNANPFKST